jgi:hypothetical protein
MAKQHYTMSADDFANVGEETDNMDTQETEGDKY